MGDPLGWSIGAQRVPRCSPRASTHYPRSSECAAQRPRRTTPKATNRVPQSSGSPPLTLRRTTFFRTKFSLQPHQSSSPSCRSLFESAGSRVRIGSLARLTPQQNAPMMLAKRQAHIGTKMNESAAVDEPVAVPPQSKSHARWKRAIKRVTETANAVQPIVAERLACSPYRSAAKPSTTGNAFQSVNPPCTYATSRMVSRKGMARIAFI